MKTIACRNPLKSLGACFVVGLFCHCTLTSAAVVPPVADLALWLNASDSDSLILDKHLRVSEWKSRGQKNISLIQEKASQRPVFSKTSNNGNPGVYFDGTEWLTAPPAKEGDTAIAQFSIFVVFQIEEEHPLRLMGMLGNGGLDKKAPGWMLGVNDSHIVNWNNSVALAVHDGVRTLAAAAKTGDSRKLGLARTVPTRFPVLLSTVFHAGQRVSTVIRLQGEKINHKIPSAPSSAGITLLPSLTVGATSRDGSHPFRGAIAEVLIYDRALTEQECKQVEAWLKKRHNLKKISPIIFDPRVQNSAMTIRPQTITRDGVFLRMADDTVCESTDGKKWTEKFPVARDPAFPDLRLSGGLMAITQSGAMVLILRDPRPDGFVKIKREGNGFNKEAKSRIYAFRSLDGGKTWRDGQLIQTAYCGAMRDIKVTASGHVVASLQAWDAATERHVTMIYNSNDDGKTYRVCKVDNGIGQGMHDGFFESTLAELNNGELLMLGRTSLGVFWESRSKDSGLTWSNPVKTDIEAGSYPGFLIRLKSGRLMLAWNRYYPDGYKGRDDLINMAGKSWFWGAHPTSRFNRELSIMFSNDVGKSWTSPIVAAEGRQDFAALCYPFLIEREPGEIYIWAGSLAAKLYEKDFFP